MSASYKCHHPNLSFGLEPIADGDRIFVRMNVVCPDCSGRFRFIGVSSEYNRDAPTANLKATEAVLPMEVVV